MVIFFEDIRIKTDISKINKKSMIEIVIKMKRKKIEKNIM